MVYLTCSVGSNGKRWFRIYCWHGRIDNKNIVNLYSIPVQQCTIEYFILVEKLTYWLIESDAMIIALIEPLSPYFIKCWLDTAQVCFHFRVFPDSFQKLEKKTWLNKFSAQLYSTALSFTTFLYCLDRNRFSLSQSHDRMNGKKRPNRTTIART